MGVHFRSYDVSRVIVISHELQNIFRKQVFTMLEQQFIYTYTVFI